MNDKIDKNLNVTSLNKNWEDTFNILQDLIAEIDLDYRITKINKSMADRLNGNADDFIGCSCFSLIHGTDKPPSFCPHSELLNDKQYHSKEFPIESLHGDFSVSVSPIFNDNNQLAGSVHVVHEISDRKKLEKLSNFLAAIVESSNNAIIGKDLDTNITSWNDAAEKLYGYSYEEVVGKSISILSPSNFSNDLDYIMNKIKKGELIKNYDTKRKTKDGRLVDVSLSISPIFDSNGLIIGVSTISTDITERKKDEKYKQQLLEKEQLLTKKLQTSNEELRCTTEELQTSNEELRCTTEELQTSNEELQKVGIDLHFANDKLQKHQTAINKINLALLESESKFSNMFHKNPAAITLSDSEGRYIDINESFSKLTGYEYDELIGHTSTELNITNSEERKQYLNRFKYEDSPDPSEFRIRTKSGEKRIVINNSELIQLDHKINYITFAYDITERKQYEEKLESLTDELKRSNDELQRFAYVSSHDLQEPLRMVTSFTQLLERRYKNKLDKDADEYIEFIVEGAKRMKMLIDDLLIFSRLNNNVIKYENVNIKTILDTILLNLQATIDETSTQITHDPLPLVNGDPLRLVQVFQNLISNSIKFNNKKIPKIHITAKNEGNQWLFKVSDNGIGIDSRHQEKIFTIFQRLHTRQEYEGTGIGLAIVKKIIQQNGGHIWAKSKLNKGTEFYFTIRK